VSTPGAGTRSPEQDQHRQDPRRAARPRDPRDVGGGALDRVLDAVAAIGHRPGQGLRAVRATATASWCAAVAVAALVVAHPLALAALVAAVLVVGHRAGASAEQRRALLLAMPLALLVVAVNALVVRDGLTVLARLGTWPLLGRMDVTLEAVVAGATLALRLLVLLPLGALLLVAVDPDALLRALRPRWPAAALTGALALRVVPVLARDGRRMADARRLRPAGTPGALDDRGARTLVARAVLGSALERSGDLAVALELRGHALGRRPTRPSDPWARADLVVAAAAVAVVAVVAMALALGALRTETIPRVAIPVDAAALALVVLLAAATIVPGLLRAGPRGDGPAEERPR